MGVDGLYRKQWNYPTAMVCHGLLSKSGGDHGQEQHAMEGAMWRAAAVPGFMIAMAV